MAKTLRVPDEYRFVRAFALAVEPGDILCLLLEIGALGSRDLGIVRRTRKVLDAVYDHASVRKDWDQSHTISVLREALAQPDSAACLAYAAKDNRQAHEYAEALAVVGCAADSLSSHRRPWKIEPNDLSLPDWREQVWKLLFGMPCPSWPASSVLSTSTSTAGRCASNAEAILAEAALANAQLAVAKAVLQTGFRQEGATDEEAAAKAEEVVEEMTSQLVFGQVPMQRKAKRRRYKPEVKVIYFRSLFEDDENGKDEDKTGLPPADQPVQLAMFAP